MATIDEVAKLANVSAATVSRVANGSYRMNTDKYRRVTEAMKELGYEPRERISAAESESAAENKYSVIVFTYTSLSGISEILPELERAARRLSIKLTYKLVMSTDELSDAERLMREYDGAILCDFDLSREEYLSLSRIKPLVSCRKQYRFRDAFSVSIDDELAGSDATFRLINDGCRQPLFVGHSLSKDDELTPQSVYQSVHQLRRYMGYAGACAKEKIAPLPAAVLPHLHGADGILRAGTVAEAFAEPRRRPDGVICQYLSDVWAVRAIIAELGLTLPGDVAAIAFVDSQHTSDIPIPVVTQRLAQLADTTVRMLRLLIRGELKRGEPLTVYTAHDIIG